MSREKTYCILRELWMRIIEVTTEILIGLLILSIGVFGFLSAGRSFQRVRESSTLIKSAVKADLAIRETLLGRGVSYLSSRENAVKQITESLKSIDLGDDTQITDVDVFIKDSSNLFSGFEVSVKYSIKGREYESYVRF